MVSGNGSANYSDNSTTDNEENTVVICGDGGPVARRVADIYLTEYHRLFMHFVYRDWATRETVANAVGPGTARLVRTTAGRGRIQVWQLARTTAPSVLGM